jgi:hypothetical protein
MPHRRTLSRQLSHHLLWLLHLLHEALPRDRHVQGLRQVDLFRADHQGLIHDRALGSRSLLPRLLPSIVSSFIAPYNIPLIFISPR